MFVIGMHRKLKCVVRLASLMSEGSHRSELLTQLLLNDKATLLQDGVLWIYIEGKFTGTKGWVLKAQFAEIDEAMYHALPLSITVPDSHLIASAGFIPGTFHDEMPDDDGRSVLVGTIAPIEAVMRTLLFSFLEAPYMWGGVTHFGIDCSGLSLLFYRFYGIHLTPFASEQFEQGSTLDFLQEARCGDLAFFESDEEEIIHVGILLNPGEIVHATEKAGKVVIDAIDQEGIISRQSGKRTHRLRLVKRYLS